VITKIAKVTCPTCGGTVEWVQASRFRPFCSERCKNIDLGAWAEERYAIPDAASPGEEGAENDTPARPN
jgi:endogenous inhibitor of DNA gyrase (YacG/DUF329 family)